MYFSQETCQLLHKIGMLSYKHMWWATEWITPTETPSLLPLDSPHYHFDFPFTRHCRAFELSDLLLAENLKKIDNGLEWYTNGQLILEAYWRGLSNLEDYIKSDVLLISKE